MAVEGHHTYQRTEVVITDIKMPFLSMVVFIMKWVLASIPAMIILWVVTTVLFFLFSMVFGAAFMGMSMNSMQ